jgi:Protein of unknown function (DUF2950)
VPAVSVVADSAVAASVVEVSAEVGFDVKPPLKRILMSQFISNHKILLITLLVSLASCSKPVEPSKPSKPSVEKVVPRNFASPSEAGAALLAAAQSGDRAALLEIFGPGGEEILFTGDAARDKASLQDFVTAYTRMNRWGKIKAGGQTLYIGSDNYAFPIPLGQNTSGQWYFDSAAGKDEILARRIGQNELTAIAACQTLADSEKQYFRQTHDGGRVKEYAQKFVSDPGKQNGLYWLATDGRPSRLEELGDFGKSVASIAGDQPPLFKGYYYRILTRPSELVNGKMTGGFTILAYPAEYRNSGIMAFIVGKDGVVYEKDLGEKTGEVGKALSELNLADGWSPAVPPTVNALRAQR